MLTRITDQKMPCVYIVYRITKNWGPGLYNSLWHADNRRYFLGLSLTRNWQEAHVLPGKGSGEIWACSCWEKVNFIMINEFKYGQIWKIWPSLLSLSLYNSFKVLNFPSDRSLHNTGSIWIKSFWSHFSTKLRSATLNLPIKYKSAFITTYNISNT